MSFYAHGESIATAAATWAAWRIRETEEARAASECAGRIEIYQLAIRIIERCRSINVVIETSSRRWSEDDEAMERKSLPGSAVPE